MKFSIVGGLEFGCFLDLDDTLSWKDCGFNLKLFVQVSCFLVSVLAIFIDYFAFATTLFAFVHPTIAFLSPCFTGLFQHLRVITVLQKGHS